LLRSWGQHLSWCCWHLQAIHLDSWIGFGSRVYTWSTQRLRGLVVLMDDVWAPSRAVFGFSFQKIGWYWLQGDARGSHYNGICIESIMNLYCLKIYICAHDRICSSTWFFWKETGMNKHTFTHKLVSRDQRLHCILGLKPDIFSCSRGKPLATQDYEFDNWNSQEIHSVCSEAPVVLKMFQTM